MSDRHRPQKAFVGAAVAVYLWCACGTYQPPSEPSPPAPVLVRITITDQGPIPAALTSAAPVMVEFMNASADTHDIRSDPHPEHTGCLEFNLVSLIPPGSRVAILAPLESGRSCKYHDETRISDTRFQGSVVVR